VTEALETFDCFGSTCTVLVGGPGATAAAATARSTLLSWHDRFSRFRAESELSRVNADPSPVVTVSPMMARLADAVVAAARQTDGLVDSTLVSEIEAAGYGASGGHRADAGAELPLERALALAPRRRPAGARAPSSWRQLAVDGRRRRIMRPPGLRIDSGGLAKGLFADTLAHALHAHPSLAIVCGGDLRVAGTARAVDVESPFDGRIVHTFEVADAGVATSGIGRRSWIGPDGAPAHHLLDPATGRPAFTGVVQATAIAPTALQAEIRAKAALLSGPAGAAAWLPDGGALVLDDGHVEVLAPEHPVRAAA
jgi:thiamine biosynthesis lipoprotein